MKLLVTLMSRLGDWLQARWRARQRRIDMKILWPACKDVSCGDMDVAKAAFASHAFHDEAWTADYTEDELIAFIGKLK